MKISREEKKIEAVERMKILGIYPETIRQFEKQDIVSVSVSPFGAFFWVSGELREIIKQFEHKTGSLVYLVVRSYTDIGKMDSLFFVSDYKDEEWTIDREDLQKQQALVYVHNYDADYCSEFGSIGFEATAAAGLRRVW